MFSGQVSRGRCLGVVADSDRIAEAQGAATLAFDYPPTRADPFHDRVYRDSSSEGGVTEVWCRSGSLRRIKDTASIENLPLAEEAFRVKKPRTEPIAPDAPQPEQRRLL